MAAIRILCVVFMLFPFHLFAQKKVRMISRTHHEFGSMLGSNGDMTALAFNRIQYWGVGKKDKHFKFGLGLRLTAALGAKQNLYITAPAILTSGKTGPGVFFADQVNQNIDTLIMRDGTQNFLLNTYLALSYDFTSRWGAEFNIDLAGISVGPSSSGTIYFKEGKTNSPYAGDSREQSTSASPSFGNVLLISDNDRGSLNSEFFVSYKIKSKTKLKAGAAFLFNEYKVKSPVSYTNSIGTFVDTDRYRIKSLMFVVGASVILNKFKHGKKSKSSS